MTSFGSDSGFTSSFGWTVRAPPRRSSRIARTSFMFVFVEVPEPVW